MVSKVYFKVGNYSLFPVIGINDIKILCQCPPSLALFLASLQANIAVGNGVHNLGISVVSTQTMPPQSIAPVVHA